MRSQENQDLFCFKSHDSLNQKSVASGARNSEVSLQLGLPVEVIGTITSLLNMYLRFHFHEFHILQVFGLVLAFVFLFLIAHTTVIEVDLPNDMEDVRNITDVEEFRNIRFERGKLLLLKLAASFFIMWILF